MAITAAPLYFISAPCFLYDNENGICLEKVIGTWFELGCVCGVLLQKAHEHLHLTFSISLAFLYKETVTKTK